MFEVVYKGIAVGKASIYKEGMFYCVVCKCYLPKSGVYRVKMTDGNKEWDLGICVPDENIYSCTARFPCKRLTGNDYSFVLTAAEGNLSIPVESGTTFAHLDKINAARLQYANGQPHILIAPNQDQQGNDPNLIHPHK